MTDHEPTRVLSIPAEHPYVQHTLGAVHGAVVLDDPTTPWWPPLGLDPTWLREHRCSFDLVHVHFGFEQVPAAQLEAWCATTTELDVPVVVTVHDLRNPHLDDNSMHERQLEVLLDRADAVITLTPGAAAEIRRRYGKQPLVLAHPHLVPLDHLARQMPATRPRTVGLNFGSGRANLVPPRSIVPELATRCAWRGATLRVSVQAHARPGVIATLCELRDEYDFQLSVGPRSSDDSLFAEVAALHVNVLPYRFGTHSGWIELCRDLGTRVIAPDCGHYAEQWGDVERYALDADLLPVQSSLGDALDRALLRPAPRPADRSWRTYQRDAIAAAHRVIYTAMMRRKVAATTTTR